MQIQGREFRSYKLYLKTYQRTESIRFYLFNLDLFILSVIYIIIFNLYKNIQIWQLENLNQVIQNFKKK